MSKLILVLFGLFDLFTSIQLIFSLEIMGIGSFSFPYRLICSNIYSLLLVTDMTFILSKFKVILLAVNHLLMRLRIDFYVL